MENSPQQLRRCVRCEQDKQRNEFSKLGSARDGLQSWCKACMSEYMRAKRPPTVYDPKPCEYCGKHFRPKDRRRRFCSDNCKMRARYWRENPREAKACRTCGVDLTARRRDVEYCSNHCAMEARKVDGRITPDRRRAWRLAAKYGLTLEAFDALVSRQGGRCAICQGMPEVWHVDHCHSTGKVRGLLCSPCNTGLGHLKDDPDRLRRAARYLERHQKE